jgi:hypothetical protein
MRETAQNIVAIAKRLLDECKVEMVIGFRKGSLPMMNEPCVARTPAEAEALVWDSHCGVNLANYLTGRKEKIAVVAKGCDSRNIANHIIENKVVPDNLTIIGVPCSGMVDRRKVAARFEGEIREVAEDGETLTVTGDGFDGILNRSEVLQDNCRVCTHRNPVIYDELAGEAVPSRPVWIATKTCVPSRRWNRMPGRNSSMIFLPPASAAMPAAMPARCVIAPPVSWTNPVPSGLAKPGRGRYQDLSFPAGLSLRRSLYRLRGLPAGLSGGNQHAFADQEAGDGLLRAIRLGSRAGHRDTACAGSVHGG